MALLGSKADFEREISKRKRKCGECGERIMLGQPCLISRRGGVVRKVVCSEKCRQDFDDRYWNAKAILRNEKQEERTAFPQEG